MMTVCSQKTRDNNVMHAKPDLRVFLKWVIAGSGSVITDVIPLEALLYECEICISSVCRDSGLVRNADADAIDAQRTYRHDQ